jgi:hypothetical protein
MVLFCLERIKGVGGEVGSWFECRTALVVVRFSSQTVYHGLCSSPCNRMSVGFKSLSIYNCDCLHVSFLDLIPELVRYSDY